MQLSSLTLCVCVCYFTENLRQGSSQGKIWAVIFKYQRSAQVCNIQNRGQHEIGWKLMEGCVRLLGTETLDVFLLWARKRPSSCWWMVNGYPEVGKYDESLLEIVDIALGTPVHFYLCFGWFHANPIIQLDQYNLFNFRVWKFSLLGLQP